MENLDIKTISYDGEDIQLEVSTESTCWSAAVVDDLKIRKFESRRTHIPQPLFIDDTAVVEELNSLYRLSMKLSQPGFDWGLGCFSNLSKMTEASKYDDLCWFDVLEINTAKELLNGNQVWDSDDAWIRFVRSTQKSEEPKTEEQLIQFHTSQSESPNEVEHVHIRPHTSDADRFLAMLDKMESALQVGNEARSISASAEYPRWVLRNFKDWIEEAEFIEANVSAPSGSRYYTTSDTN